MFPSCPNGTTKLKSDNLCVYDCSTNFEPFNQDELYCVKTLCPLDYDSNPMLKDLTDNSICIKLPKAKTNGWCDEGFTEWLTDSCFKNCDQTTRDFGQSCIIPVSRRSFVFPECWTLFNLSENRDFCIPSIYLILIIVAIVIYYVRRNKIPNLKPSIQPDKLNLMGQPSYPSNLIHPPSIKL